MTDMPRKERREIARLHFREVRGNSISYRLSIGEEDGFLHYQLSVNDTPYGLSGIAKGRSDRLPQDVTAAMTNGDLADQVAGLILEEPSRFELVQSHVPYPNDPLDPRMDFDTDDRPGP